ncbi:MAG: 2-C-methyl-D-erythritol 4-phosphate cytidylyltransferase [Bacteroidia bacterium]|jgi:2-C-methyl-D-erythritol 4-phosphate cytidylyltransferase|nr:MAG: 2-C-methyl-D-erythritol 4-phosphate cytidylyltransferase [Bacteroidia bacterium]
MRRAAIIVAGGSGIRMGTELPKQYLELVGKPLIVHALEKFLLFDASMKVVVVLAPSHRDHWNAISDKYELTSWVTVAHGGKCRYDSVNNGLVHVADGMVVGIHDAVRPLVSQGTLERSYSAAVKWGSGVPVIALEDSVRMLDAAEGSTPVDRTLLRRVQTPQVFQSSMIKQAYHQISDLEFTDDASVYESLFGHVKLVEGNPENIKITTPADLKLATALIQSVD